jgi:hypothetical protein
MCICALFAQTVYGQNSTVSSLSGYAYLDADHNYTPSGADWGIVGAVVTLIKENDASFTPYSVHTNSKGFYWFDGPTATDHSGLPQGTYTIRLDTSSALHSMNNVGTLWDMTLHLPLPEDQQTLYQGYALTDTSTQDDEFMNIDLTSTTSGVNYNFGEAAFPIELISKRLLLSTTDPLVHVPEPGTLALLAAGAIAFFGLAISRCRKSRDR